MPRIPGVSASVCVSSVSPHTHSLCSRPDAKWHMKCTNWKAFWHLISPDSKYIFQCFASALQLINTKTKTFPANKAADIDGSIARCLFMVTEREQRVFDPSRCLTSCTEHKTPDMLWFPPVTRVIIYFILNDKNRKWPFWSAAAYAVALHSEVVAFSGLTRFVKPHSSTRSRYGTDAMMTAGVKSRTGTFIARAGADMMRRARLLQRCETFVKESHRSQEVTGWWSVREDLYCWPYLDNRKQIWGENNHWNKCPLGL